MTGITPVELDLSKIERRHLINLCEKAIKNSGLCIPGDHREIQEEV